MHDVRHALRFVLSRPVFALVAGGTLALGIGASTLVFSIADATLFKPLPYRAPDRLVDIFHVNRRGTPEATMSIGMSLREAAAWRSQTQLFSGVEVYASGPTRILRRHDGSTDPIPTGKLSPGMLSLLGISPALGRGFTRDEGVPGRDHVVLLSHSLWRQAFGGDPKVAGRIVVLDRTPYTVVGVMPASFRYIPARQARVWVPLTTDDEFGGVVARLRDGIGLDQANLEAHVAAPRVAGLLRTASALDVDLRPIDVRRTSDDARTGIAVVLIGVVLVLLVACANVSALLLAEATGRQREFAIRLSLGATPLRLARLRLCESAVLALAGALGGVALTEVGVQLIPAIAPAKLALFDAFQLTMDARVLAFATVVAVLATLMTGIASLVRGRASIAIDAVGRSATVTHSRRRFLPLLSLQVAFTMVLLTGAGLLSASFLRLERVPDHYPSGDLTYVDFTFPSSPEPSAAPRAQFYDGLIERVRHLPSVAGATIGTAPPRAGFGIFVPQGMEDRDRSLPLTAVHTIDPDYFDVTGIRLLAGRGPLPSDTPSAPPVAVISRAAARRFWGNATAIGRQFRYSPYVDWITVIGVATDVKTNGFGVARDAVEIYVPRQQGGEYGGVSLLVRSRGDVGAMLSSVRTIARAVNPDVAITAAGTVSDLYYAGIYASPRFFLLFVSVFAGLALVIAATGLGAGLSYAVVQRTREIGIRLAIGASAAHVSRVVLVDTFWAVGIGVALGTVATWWGAELLTSMLFHTAPHDPLVSACAVVGMLMVAAVAAYVPVRRAVRLDPAITLRAD